MNFFAEVRKVKQTVLQPAQAPFDNQKFFSEARNPMIISNHKRIGLALELLKMGIAPYIGREIKLAVKKGEISRHIIRDYVEDAELLKTEITQWDLKPLLKLMDDTWNVIFQDTLGFSEHSLLGELREWLNKWEHQTTIDNDDTDRILDSVARFLNAIQATDVATDAEKLKKEFRRFLYEEQTRAEQSLEESDKDAENKPDPDLIRAGYNERLKPWRDVITPREHITDGRYLKSGFDADLWQVYQAEAAVEYRDPVDFFQQTYLTQSLKTLVTSSIQRVTRTGGQPVVRLQSGFGGGKTHSLIALYNLFSGVNASEMSGVTPLMEAAGVYSLPIVKRAVLIGNKISPSTPAVKPNGLTIRTLWGELAYQLGGKKAFEKIREHDKKGTSPGKKLHELIKFSGPCVILVDEWVAYARQLVDRDDFAGGRFDEQCTFARDLVEAIKATKNCLLVISLPVAESEKGASSNGNDIEIGGSHGLEALRRLQESIGEAESSWQPATSEEDLEIVRCRLFEPIEAKSDKFIKMTAMAFTELYIQKGQEFPPETQTSSYKRRIQDAYPIHPEIFDRLYNDWTSLILFQRTRGVLRLMASVIHSLWQKGDRNPVILPSTIPINDKRVQSELTRHLPEAWTSIIPQDIDGPDAAALKVDAAYSHLGQLQAARRVARTIYLGSSPSGSAAEHGIDERRVVLGCVMPGESPTIFNDAIHPLATGSNYLNQADSQLWYATAPSLTVMAKDRAEALSREPEAVALELEKQLEDRLGTCHDFAGVHLAGRSGEEIPDDLFCRLVVLPADKPFHAEADNDAVTVGKEILETFGTDQRMYRNTLVFLAADKESVSDLEEAVRIHLAWNALIYEQKELGLDDQQIKEAEVHKSTTENSIQMRLQATYKWVIVPTQEKAGGDLAWKAIGLDTAGALAEAAALELRDKMLMLSAMDALTLRMQLDQASLWEQDHVSLTRLREAFAECIYLPRLAGPQVLLDAAREGVAMPSWEEESFAFADSLDAESGLFAGLKAGESVGLDEETNGLLVKAEAAARQLAPPEVSEDEKDQTEEVSEEKTEVVLSESDEIRLSTNGAHREARNGTELRSLHESITLNSKQAAHEAGRITQELIDHLSGQTGAELTVTLEVKANLPGGVDEQLARVVMECGMAKKTSQLKLVGK